MPIARAVRLFDALVNVQCYGPGVRFDGRRGRPDTTGLNKLMFVG